jgi:hypothetical protein
MNVGSFFPICSLILVSRGDPVSKDLVLFCNTSLLYSLGWSLTHGPTAFASLMLLSQT